MLFLLNIGNTHTQIAELAQGKISLLKKVLTTELNSQMIPKGKAIAAATVVPEVRTRLEECDIFWLEPDCLCDIDLSLIDTSTLGADRLANLIALADNVVLPALCIDFGTAITFELLDKNKVFLGGAITPGRALLRNCLHNNTAQLPFVPLESTASNVPGRTTKEQIALGTDLGVVGMVKEIIKLMQKNVNEDLTIVATGGDAKKIIKDISGIEYAGDDFTLKGILKAWEIYSKCK